MFDFYPNRKVHRTLNKFKEKFPENYLELRVIRSLINLSSILEIVNKDVQGVTKDDYVKS